MRTTLMRAGALMVLSALLLSVAACTSGASPSTDTSGASLELVKNKCTMCHTIDRINEATKDTAGWEETVTRMRAKGAVLTDAEAAQIVEYLSSSKAAQ